MNTSPLSAGSYRAMEEKDSRKKPSISHLGRPCQSTGVLPNPRVQFKIMKAVSSGMEAAGHDGKIQRNTSVTSGSSLKESIAAMEFEMPEIEGEINVGTSEPVSTVEDACKKFRKCVIEMIVDKNASDLMDVEELLYCYRNLSCPVYRDLLNDFFAEICSDVFAASASSSLDDD